MSRKCFAEEGCYVDDEDRHSKQAAGRAEPPAETPALRCAKQAGHEAHVYHDFPPTFPMELVGFCGAAPPAGVPAETERPSPAHRYLWRDLDERAVPDIAASSMRLRCMWDASGEPPSRRRRSGPERASGPPQSVAGCEHAELTIPETGAKEVELGDRFGRRIRAGDPGGAHVSREGGLAVVTHIHVRRLVRRGGAGSRARREERRRR